MFGLFNVITAVFVDATLTGLQMSDIQKKANSLYESSYTRFKLNELMFRINAVTCGYDVASNESEVILGQPITSADFEHVMADKEIDKLLHELDVVIDRRNTNLFDIFDIDGNGEISVAEFITTLMKLRGELTKVDLVSVWTSLESLKVQFREFEFGALQNQKIMLENQMQLLVQPKENG